MKKYRFRLFFTTILLLCVTPNVAQSNPALSQSLNTCIEKLKIKNYKSNKSFRFDKLCPKTYSMLSNEPKLKFFTGKPLEKTTIRVLTDIKVLIDETKKPLTRQHLDKQLLSNIMAETDVAKIEAEQSLLDRIGAWFKNLLDKWRKSPKKDKNSPKWLQSLIDMLNNIQISEQLGKVIFIALQVLLVAFTIWIIIREFKKIQRRARSAVDSSLSKETDLALDHESIVEYHLDKIKELTPAQQAKYVLLWALQQLRNRGLLPKENSYTNRELAKFIGSIDHELATCLKQIIKAFDRLVYGKKDLSHEELNASLEAAYQIDKLLNSFSSSERSP